jgi:phage shock protein A
MLNSIGSVMNSAIIQLGEVADIINQLNTKVLELEREIDRLRREIEELKKLREGVKAK